MEEFKTLTREELKSWMDEEKDFVLVDVLSEGSYNSKHLPGAKHASVKESDFLEKIQEMVPEKDKPVVVYCGSFSCQLSPFAAHKLSEMGYTEVYDFEGGLADWQDGGYSLEGATAEEEN